MHCSKLILIEGVGVLVVQILRKALNKLLCLSQKVLTGAERWIITWIMDILMVK